MAIYYASDGHPSVGVTPPIFIARDGADATVRPGKDYFLVQVAAAQAVFTGSIWTKARRLIVASNVSLSRPGLIKETLQAIQRSRVVKPGRAEKLGLRPNLISLVPSVMADFSISFEFIIDQQDRLAALSSLINDDSFLAAVSLAPGASMVAKTVGGLAQKVLATFFPQEERRPILQFSGDFNIADGSLREGYYAILGTHDGECPLPKSISELSVQNGVLFASSKEVTMYSYVILDVRRVEVRTRELNEGAPWEDKLREAEDEARLPESEAAQSWEKCRTLLREAQVLLRADMNYLRHEAEAIIIACLANCKAMLATGAQPQTRDRPASTVLTEADVFGMELPDGQLASEVLKRYAAQASAARAILNKP